MFMNSTDKKAISIPLNNKAGYFDIKITNNVEGELAGKTLINGHSMGEYKFSQDKQKYSSFVDIKLPPNSEISFHDQYGNGSGEIEVECIPVEKKPFNFPSFELNNKNAIENSKSVMNYLKSIYTKKMITGQHWNIGDTLIDEIKSVTGKCPAIKSFDYIGYGIGTENVPEATEHCLMEVEYGKAHATEDIIDWVKNKGGIATSCWHWFSPLNGVNKRFYTEFSDFDASLAATEGTKEFEAINKDLDIVAAELKKLCDLNIPVLWRPFHEADGGWFWWGAKGAEAYKKLYWHMYNRFTNEFKLNNLIWVWNAPQDDWYVGDEYCDLVGSDIYNESFNYGPSTAFFKDNLRISGGNKPVVMSENGSMPDLDLMKEFETYWLYFTTWCWSDSTNDYFGTSAEQLKKIYNHQDAITLDKLPNLYKF